MARDGEILNVDALREMATRLNVGGVRRMPRQLNTDDVKVVHVLNLPPSVANEGAIEYSVYEFNALDVSGAGTGSWTPFGAFAPGTALPGFTSGLNLDNTNREAKVLSSTILIGYDLPGAAADAALGVRLEIIGILQPPGLGVGLAFPVNDVYADVQAGRFDYLWSWPEGVRGSVGSTLQRERSGFGWDGRVPPGWSFAWQIARTPGTGPFPTNMSGNGYGHVAMRPLGLQSW